MKFLLPLSFLVLTFAPNFPAQAQTRYSYSQRAPSNPASVFCTEQRFDSYIALAKGMRDFVTPHEYARLYLPLKTKASQAKITLRNYGPLSRTTHKSLLEIVSFVDRNQSSFDTLWEVEAFFDVATDLMDMTQNLNRDLQ